MREYINDLFNEILILLFFEVLSLKLIFDLLTSDICLTILIRCPIKKIIKMIFSKLQHLYTIKTLEMKFPYEGIHLNIIKNIYIFVFNL